MALGGGVALISDPVLAGGRDLGPFWFVFAATLVGAQIYRHLRVSGTVERQQTKWVVYSVALILCVALGMFFVTQVKPPSEPFGTLMGALLRPTANVVLLVLPLSLGVAILRCRLWDIDPFINRTLLVYGALTAASWASTCSWSAASARSFRLEALAKGKAISYRRPGE